MIAAIQLRLPQPDLDGFQSRLRAAGIIFTAVSRKTSEQIDGSLPPIVEVGGRISNAGFPYTWTQACNGTHLKIEALKGSSPLTQQLVEQLERAFPECQPIRVVDSDTRRYRMSTGDRLVFVCVGAILILAAFGLYTLIAHFAHSHQ